MPGRSSFRVGDLRSTGATRLTGWLDALDRAPSWLVIAGSGIATAAVAAAGLEAWSAWAGRAPWREAPALHRADGAEPGAPGPAALGPAPPRAFPAWAAVPRLGGPAARDGAGPAADPAPRTFEAATIEARRWLAEAMAPARNAGPAPAEAAVLAPDDAPTLAPSVAIAARPASHPRPRARPVIEVRRPARREGDADQTASILGRPGPGSARFDGARPDRPMPDRSAIDAGAVARASIHRARPGASPSPRAPAAPWTLPPALAPSP